MSLVMGYVGPQSMNQNFTDNPLEHVANARIMLYDWEVAQATARLGTFPWEKLNPSMRRQVARNVLQYRGTAEAQKQLDALGLNNPNFNNIEVITTDIKPQVSRSSGGLLQHFLL